MALIVKNSAVIKDDDAHEEMQPLVDAYWGAASLERVFPIPFWKLKQLFDAFPSSEVALKVTDITSITLVNAEWVAFDEDLEGVLVQASVQPNTRYYVLSEAAFANLQENAANVEVNSLIITGRLGKLVNPQNQQVAFCAFICASELKILSPQGGNDGATTGFRLPPP